MFLSSGMKLLHSTLLLPKIFFTFYFSKIYCFDFLFSCEQLYMIKKKQLETRSTTSFRKRRLANLKKKLGILLKVD